MSKVITRLKLHNFRRFRKFDVSFNNEVNLLIGDNESGKSSILQSLNLVMSGSRSKVETLGLDIYFVPEKYYRKYKARC